MKNKKAFGDTRVGGYVKSLLGGAIGGLGTELTKEKIVLDAGEDKTGDLLGKYKGWIIGGLVLVVVSIAASAMSIFGKKKGFR